MGERAVCLFVCLHNGVVPLKIRKPIRCQTEIQRVTSESWVCAIVFLNPHSRSPNKTRNKEHKSSSCYSSSYFSDYPPKLFSFRELAHQMHTHTHKPSLSNTEKNQPKYFFLSMSSPALNKTKLLQKHTKQSSSSDKTSLQNTHTHTRKKTKTMFLGACYYHSTKHKSLSTSNQKLQSSVIFVAHICYQPNAPKKRQCMMNTFFSSSVMICKT
jgi:hypothetical protein